LKKRFDIIIAREEEIEEVILLSRPNEVISRFSLKARFL